MEKELPDKRGVLLEMYDERAFSRDAIREFAELATELSAEANLLHVQVAIFGRIVQEEVHHHALRLTARIFGFLEQALEQPQAISEIANAIETSFVEVEQLQQTDTGRSVLRMLPSRLKCAMHVRSDGAQ